MKRVISIWLLVFSILTLAAVEKVDFLSKPLTAGKASLTENGFIVSQLLGTANFSPDLRFPVQLTYNSASEKTGIFGYAWRSPQLESSAVPQRDGVLWTAPWGEQIRFFSKNEKTSKDAVKIELYEQARKGRGFYSPYSEWEAQCSERDFAKSGSWIFNGKRGKLGWRFIYRDAKLQKIEAPSGRSIEFSYSRGKLVSISQNNRLFIELEYEEMRAAAIRINGITTKLTYKDTDVTVLPKIVLGKMIQTKRPVLFSLVRAELTPIEFSYTPEGYLAGMRQGNFSDEFKVQTETLAERQQNLQSQDRKSSVKHTGRVAGRLLADSFLTYRYDGEKPGNVTLTNKLRQTAKYDFDEKTGVFKLKEFSGREFTIYYFMRYDVAYLGKVRQIMDGRKRIVASYRYDKLSGNLIRVRDMAENDINFTYNRAGELTLVTRRAADQDRPEPVLRMKYNGRGMPLEIIRLNGKGETYSTVKYTYTQDSLPQSVGNGQNTTRFVYNPFGYPLQIIDTFGRKNIRVYDKYNRLTESTDHYGVVTKITYGRNGLVTRIARMDGNELLSSLEVACDGAGRPVSYRDRDGNVKKFERDAFGRIVKEIFPDDTSVEYTYNVIGQLDKVLDQNRHEIKFGWDRFGLDRKVTAANQLTDYVYDKFGLLKHVDSKFRGGKKKDRSIAYEYDKFDRIVKVSYDNGRQVETFRYNSWGKLIGATKDDGREKRVASYQYDYYNRLSAKSESVNGGDPVVTVYRYNQWDQRTLRELRNGALRLTEEKTYDRFGRLSKIKSGSSEVIYYYNSFNQLEKRLINNVPEYYYYTKYGQLRAKTLGAEEDKKPLTNLKYFYSRPGMIVAREVNGAHQNYKYDKKGQLLGVYDGKGNVVEEYVYDPAGNILKKTIHGKTTTYKYDKANQLVSSECNGKFTKSEYDAAGRLVKEGDKVYSYIGLDKIESVTEGGQKLSSFSYHIDGQLAEAVTPEKRETFQWDGLALIQRNSTNYVNEPAVTGGNPILADDKVLFNDMLGTTLGVKDGDRIMQNNLTAFGESLSTSPMQDSFFTGKPLVGELGYAFLFRNYRADQGKWQTSDPLGYPDGWNNFAYCENGAAYRYDFMGGKWGNYDFCYHYFFRSNPSVNDYIDISQMGLMVDVFNKIVDTLFYQVRNEINIDAQAKILSQGGESGTISGTYNKQKGVSCGDICFAMGGGTVYFRLSYSGSYSSFTDFTSGKKYYIYEWMASGQFEYFDSFKDPVDLGNWWEGDIELPGGTPYNYGHIWETISQIKIQGGLIERPE